jgi:hypothetical protein
MSNSGCSYRRFAKNQANRKIRRKKEEKIPDNMTYKKYYERWNICDYSGYWNEKWSTPLWKARMK